MRDVVVAVLIGLVFFYAVTFLLGFTSALTVPRWLADLSKSSPEFALAIWSLVTAVPVIVLVSIGSGVLLIKFVRQHHVLLACTAVAAALVTGAYSNVQALGLAEGLATTLWPGSWFALPTYLALYLALPTTVFLLHRKSLRAR